MPWRGRALPVAGLAVAVSLLAACSAPAPTGAERAAVPSETPPPTAVVDVPVVAATPPPPRAAQPTPVELRIDGIGARLPVRPVGVQEDGTMEIPKDPAVAGWYRYGPEPGADEGSAVIAAHVDSRVLGVGPLAELRYVEPGTRVEVEDDRGRRVGFEVQSVEYIPRDALPVEEFFARSGDPLLVIITCGGSFDERTRSYSDNVVAVARPVD